MIKMVTALFMTILGFSLFGCAGSSSELIQTHVEKDRVGRPVKNALIIVVVDDQEIRTIFENHFKDWLNAKGTEAVISVDVLPVEMGAKLEKEAIVAVIDNHASDAILITHIAGLDQIEVFNRGRPRFYSNYYGFYNYASVYVTWPTVYGEKVKLRLETRLYDTKTESLIWAGETQLVNPKSTGEAIGQVVKGVMTDLEKNGLLPETPKDKN